MDMEGWDKDHTRNLADHRHGLTWRKNRKRQHNVYCPIEKSRHNEGIERAVLSNAHMWQLYHIRFARPITQELVFSVDLLDENVALTDKVKLSYLVSKQSMAENIIGQYWAEESALSIDNILSVLLS